MTPTAAKQYGIRLSRALEVMFKNEGAPEYQVNYTYSKGLWTIKTKQTFVEVLRLAREIERIFVDTVVTDIVVANGDIIFTLRALGKVGTYLIFFKKRVDK